MTPDPDWTIHFERECEALRDALAPWLATDIEPSGSTSVPGLIAKPIIDMIAGVKDLAVLPDVEPALRGLDYHPWPHRPEAQLYVKPDVSGWREQTHALHLTVPGSDVWRERLTFRDALRADRALVHKTPFVARVLAAHGIGLRPDNERLSRSIGVHSR